MAILRTLLVLMAFSVAAQVAVKGGKRLNESGGFEDNDAIFISGKTIVESAEAKETITLDGEARVIPGLIDAYSFAFVNEDAQTTTEPVRDIVASDGLLDNPKLARRYVENGILVAGISPGEKAAISGYISAIAFSGEEAVVIAPKCRRLVCLARSAVAHFESPASEAELIAIVSRASDLKGACGLIEFEAAAARFQGKFEYVLLPQDRIFLKNFGGDKNGSYVLQPVAADVDKATLAVLKNLTSDNRFVVTTGYPATAPEFLRLQLAILRNAGFNSDKLLQSVTRNAAEFLGIDKEYGSLKPGHAAGLVVFSGDPLAFGSKILYVIVDGKVAKY